VSEELVMPRLSDTMEEGTIGRWMVHEGDSFNEGDVLAEIETDKATMEFQAYDAGTVLKILVEDGESAALGSPIAIVGAAGEEVPELGAKEPAKEPAQAESEPEPEAAEEPEPEAESEPQPEAAEKPEPAKRPKAAAKTSAGSNGSSGEAAVALKVSPIARRMADQAGIDLAGMAGRGSGPEGRVVKADVERLLGAGTATTTAAPAKPAPAAVPDDAELRDLTPMLKAIAARMSQSKQTVPHFYLESEIDMTRAMELRAELNAGLADRGEKISVNDLVVRACAMALIEHPQAHRSYVDGRHAYHAHANIGIAVALEDGLIVPVVFAADTLTVREISAATRDLAERAREGKLKQREIEGGTFSVSNLGMFDVANFEAIINPPESAILAVGATVARPVVVDGQITTRQIMRVTLSCDHRACSGADGAKLLQTVKRYLQAPALLLA
jgi:pyruvate dehydrogenase E2 component (dihydrolipoamide acetyltransferase)